MFCHDLCLSVSQQDEMKTHIRAWRMFTGYFIVFLLLCLKSLRCFFLENIYQIYTTSPFHCMVSWLLYLLTRYLCLQHHLLLSHTVVLWSWSQWCMAKFYIFKPSVAILSPLFRPRRWPRWEYKQIISAAVITFYLKLLSSCICLRCQRRHCQQ